MFQGHIWKEWESVSSEEQGAVAEGLEVSECISRCITIKLITNEPILTVMLKVSWSHTPVVEKQSISLPRSLRSKACVALICCYGFLELYNFCITHYRTWGKFSYSQVHIHDPNTGSPFVDREQEAMPSVIARQASGSTPWVRFAGTKHPDFARTTVSSATCTGEMRWNFFTLIMDLFSGPERRNWKGHRSHQMITLRRNVRVS